MDSRLWNNGINNDRQRWEFSSDVMPKVASILNVRLITTVADSPFQNGLCERVHSVADMMLLKLMEDNKKTEIQTLLS